MSNLLRGASVFVVQDGKFRIPVLNSSLGRIHSDLHIRLSCLEFKDSVYSRTMF